MAVATNLDELLMGRHSAARPNPRRAITYRLKAISTEAAKGHQNVRASISAWPEDYGYEPLAAALHDRAVKAMCFLLPENKRGDFVRAISRALPPRLALTSAFVDPMKVDSVLAAAIQPDRYDLNDHASQIAALFVFTNASQAAWHANLDNTPVTFGNHRLVLPSVYQTALRGLFPQGNISPPYSVGELIELWISDRDDNFERSLTENEKTRRRSAARLLVKATGLDLDKGFLQFDTLPADLVTRFKALSWAVGSQWARADDKAKAADFDTLIAVSWFPPKWFQPLTLAGAFDRVQNASAFYEWIDEKWLCLPVMNWGRARL